MTFSINNVAASLAQYLAPLFPGLTFYQDPVQQALQTPCAFLQQRSSTIKRRIGSRQYLEIQLDLTYLVDYNLPNMQQLYQQAAAILDENLNSFPYVGDGTGEAVFLTYDRQWRIDLDALHYNFALHVWEDLAVENNLMQTLQELNQGVTND